MVEERIQKILARAGFGSRRDCEEYLRSGRVTVNGEKVVLGAKADPGKDKILLDQKPVNIKAESIYIALYKPRQVLSAINQNDDRKNVLDLVPFEGHLFPVGRLDYDSEGLLLLTNDGDFANKLAHPRYEHEKEYLVQVGSRPDDAQLEIWRRGVVLEDGYRTASARVDVIETQPKSATLRIILREGRKRQIRESGERIGIPVQRIKRIRIGTILLGNLKPGEWRNLTRQEINSMNNPRLVEENPVEVNPTEEPSKRVSSTGGRMARTYRRTDSGKNPAVKPAALPRKRNIRWGEKADASEKLSSESHFHGRRKDSSSEQDSSNPDSNVQKKWVSGSGAPEKPSSKRASGNRNPARSARIVRSNSGKRPARKRDGTPGQDTPYSERSGEHRNASASERNGNPDTPNRRTEWDSRKNSGNFAKPFGTPRPGGKRSETLPGDPEREQTGQTTDRKIARNRRDNPKPYAGTSGNSRKPVSNRNETGKPRRTSSSKKVFGNKNR